MQVNMFLQKDFNTTALRCPSEVVPIPIKPKLKSSPFSSRNAAKTRTSKAISACTIWNLRAAPFGVG